MTALVALLADALPPTPGMAPTASLGERAHYSRTHLARMFRESVGEAPGALRRRLLLERAAHWLLESNAQVTEIALDSGYGSLEAFTRSFARAYGVSPTQFRSRPGSRRQLPTRNGIHFLAAGQGTIGGLEMEFIDRMLQHDEWLTRRMLERAQGLSDEQLDRVMFAEDPWGVANSTLRELLDRLIFTREMWFASFNGRDFEASEDRTVEGMLVRLDAIGEPFNAFAAGIAEEATWDDQFDSCGGPKATFTFGSALAHVVTFQAHRRMLALEALHSFGIEDLGYGDPAEWERERSAVPAH